MHNIIEEDLNTIIKNLGDEIKALGGKTLLISGGAGFLGSYLVAVILKLNRGVLKRPCRVIVMDNFITGSKKNTIRDVKDPNCEFIEHDVRLSLPRAIEADYVIHAAGLASPYYYQKYPLETIEVAVAGTKNFLEFSKEKKVKSFLYFSSSEIYGDPNPNFIPTPEEYWGNVSSLGPRACYDESKRLGETLSMTYFHLFGVPIKIVRPFNVYGPGMKINDYRVIPTFMVKALRGEFLPVHDKGNQTRTFCYVTDAIQGFFRVLLRGRAGQAYNVGRTEEEVNMATLASLITNLAPTKSKIQLVNYPESYPAGEPQRRCPDLTKIKQETGYDPQINLETGLKRTLEWFKEELKNGINL